MSRAATPRLMLSGCPMAVPNWKLPFLIESSGAVIVGEESCIGTRNTRDLVDEGEATLDELLDTMVDRYFKIDCACFTPMKTSSQAVRINASGASHCQFPIFNLQLAKKIAGR